MKRDPDYYKKHRAVYKARGSASDQDCVRCGDPAQEWSQIKGTTGDDPDDYQPMCCSCHQKYDDHWSDETRAKVSGSVSKARSEAPWGYGNTNASGKRTPEQIERIRVARWGR